MSLREKRKLLRSLYARLANFATFESNRDKLTLSRLVNKRIGEISERELDDLIRLIGGLVKTLGSK